VNIVDWVLVGALIVFAVIGWQRGFISGLLSFAGFLGGGLIALFILPKLLDATSLSSVARGAIVGLGILVSAFAGQLAAGLLGDRLNHALTWRPARTVDHIGGAALNVLVLAVLTWMMVSIAAYLPMTTLTSQMTQSKVAGALDALVPPQAGGVFDGLQSALSTTSVPALFSEFSGFTGPDVPPPDASADTPHVRTAASSVVRIFGTATACDTQVSGSGFVVGPELVVTNAHVVAGVTRPKIQAEEDSTRLKATLIYFDPEADIALLRVPGISREPLTLARTPASTGDSAVVAGYPMSGPFALNPVRVRTMVTARRQDIYGDGGSTMQIYIVRGTVQRGNSGGPLLAPDGTVLGMVFGADEDQATNGYALTAAEVGAAVANAHGLTEAVDPGSCRIRG
jgi:S1-C subfamily serine protease